MFYKVVSSYQRKLVSACTKNPCKVRYVINKWTKPHPKLPNSKLFIFDSFDATQCYIWDNSLAYPKIYECEAKNPTRCTEKKIFPLWAFYAPKPYNEYNISKGFAEYWKDKNSLKLYFPIRLNQVSVPKGTYWCNEVMITKRVK